MDAYPKERLTKNIGDVMALARCTAARATPDAPRLLAVDGRCGSGKSTLAAALARSLGCPVFHLDDFFLPPELRTPERLSQPGENVHHERFLREILRPFAAGQPVRFRPFDCSAGGFGAPVEIPRAPFAIAEGSYALHPSLRKYYAAAVFVTCSRETQRARLAARAGAGLADFENKWIPLEEAYFAAFSVADAADLILDTGSMPKEDAL